MIGIGIEARGEKTGLLEKVQGFSGFLLIYFVNGKSGLNNHVVSDLSLLIQDSEVDESLSVPLRTAFATFPLISRIFMGMPKHISSHPFHQSTWGNETSLLPSGTDLRSTQSSSKDTIFKVPCFPISGCNGVMINAENYCPFHCGSLFLRNAFTPSLASSVVHSSAITSFIYSRALVYSCVSQCIGSCLSAKCRRRASRLQAPRYPCRP